MSIASQIESIKAAYGDRCSVLPIGDRAFIVEVKMTPQVRCKHYFGKFNSETLQFYADSKLWSTSAPGATCPNWTVGTGRTPELAVFDAENRTRSLMKDLEREYAILKEAYLSSPTIETP